MVKKILLTAILISMTYASDVLPAEQISKDIRTHLKIGSGFKPEDVKNSNITWAETFIRFGIELCLQSLNSNKEEQAEALEHGNNIFASLINASSPVKSNHQPQQEDKQELKDFLNKALNEEIPEIVKRRAEYVTKNNKKYPETLIWTQVLKEDPKTKKTIDKGYHTLNSSWINECLDIDEENFGKEILKGIKDKSIKSLNSFSCEKLNEIYEKQIKSDFQKPKFIIVKGFDSESFPFWKEAINTDDHYAFIQLASQFNYLESTYPERSAVLQYPWDRTQGPLTAIQGVAGTIYRDVCVVNNYLDHALSDVLPEGIKEHQKELLDELEKANKNKDYRKGEWEDKDKKPLLFKDCCRHLDIYKNGYLQLHNIDNTKLKDDKEKLLQEMLNDINKTKIIAQHVICEKTGASQYQFCTAAPSYQGAKDKAPKDLNSVEGKFCTEILVAQYRALAQMAVLKSIESGRCINLHFTFVGRGVFNVPEYVELPMLNAVAEVVSGHNVKVFIHDYTGKRNWTNQGMQFDVEGPINVKFN